MTTYDWKLNAKGTTRLASYHILISTHKHLPLVRNLLANVGSA